LHVVDLASPNHDARPTGCAIDMIVMHYTGMRSAGAAIDRLRDPAAKVSAHYLIDEDGTVASLVPDELRAWHAGWSWWQGRAALNDVSLGIELVNPGHDWGYRPFPEPQMVALLELTTRLVRRWAIPPDRVVGHSDVAPTRKDDPGELFAWPRLARIGLCHEVPIAGPRIPDPSLAAQALGLFGYPGEAQGVPLKAAVRAFQRRWRPARCDGELDPETMGLAVAVAALRGRRALAT
jgi:N-acetylmuramoyl-L-alanine amidase